MKDFIFNGEYDYNFTGREKELLWLEERLLHQHIHRPIFISGIGGVGKTALIRQWLVSRRLTSQPIYINLNEYPDHHHAVEMVIKHISELPYSLDKKIYRSLVVVLDDCLLNEREIEWITGQIFNYKAVASLVFISRAAIAPSKYENLVVGAISDKESEDLLKKLFSGEFTPTDLLELIAASKGYPLAIELLGMLLKAEHTGTIMALLKQPLYELSNNLFLPKKDIISVVPPIIVSASQDIATSLQKQPSDLHKLSPREFEILLADLLRDMGWEVELTKQTRDGGADILAYLNTDVGRLLCLVEAKHYRQDRKIGVDLVRTLYGTLCDAQANSAMLVTSSSFTKDAREFQQKHQYQLSLRDYSDLVTWILKYGNNKGKIRPFDSSLIR